MQRLPRRGEPGLEAGPRAARGGDDRLLDDYVQERKPHVEVMIEMAVELARRFTITDPVIAAGRDTAMKAAAGEPPPPRLPTLVDGVLHHDSQDHPTTPAGQLFIQDLVEYEGRTGRFDDVVGHGFIVMAFNADPTTVLTVEHVTFLDLIGARRVQVSSHHRPGPDMVADLHGMYSRWFRQQNLVAVVIRPDYYVYGGAATLSELPDLINSLQRRLTMKSRMTPVQTERQPHAPQAARDVFADTPDQVLSRSWTRPGTLPHSEGWPHWLAGP